MKAIRMQEFGPSEVMRLEEVSDVSPSLVVRRNEDEG